MLNIFKRKSQDEPIKKQSWAKRLSAGLSRTRDKMFQGLTNVLRGRQTLDDETAEAIETHLLTADVGLPTTELIMTELKEKLKKKQADQDLWALLQEDMQNILQAQAKPFDVETANKPFVILTVGVNGAGKTTTIGKLAKRLQGEGKSVMLAAGDTFRAAAIEQLQAWGERNDVPVVAQHSGADSASVVYDALQAAKARGIDVLIADTAGRLHTQGHLMDELAKVKRVMGKLDEAAPHEVLLVLDAGIGQNALSQAREFNEAVGVTGICLTKLDGTAKGGIIFAIANELGIPLRFIGVGEAIDDLQPFDAQTFVSSLFTDLSQESTNDRIQSS